MEWKNDEILRQNNSETYKDDIEAYKAIKAGLESIFDKLAPVQPESPTSIVFIVSATNSYIAVAWYDPKNITDYLSTLYYLELPSIANYCDNHKDLASHFDYLCRLAVSSFCLDVIHSMRPKIKVYFKTELKTRPIILRY